MEKLDGGRAWVNECLLSPLALGDGVLISI